MTKYFHCVKLLPATCKLVGYQFCANTHLSIKELIFIESYHEQDHSGRSIARRLERSPETISRVIRKIRSGLGALEIYARYEENKKRCGHGKIQLSRMDKAHIETKVALGWTPDVIVGRSEQSLPCGASTLYRRFKEGVFIYSIAGFL